MNCPLCRQPVAWDGNRWRPFCSERCQLTDLGTWATGKYRIPGPNLTIKPSGEDIGEQEDEMDGSDVNE
jgi:endogenous inhibitor of DNA gyrase (YacG/DUF329 family)